MHEHPHDHSHYHLHANERSTRIVVIISLVAMVLELYFGYLINSRSLMMDGWHMLSHVLVLALAWVAYLYVGKKQQHITAEKKSRVIAMSGFASAVIMLVITIFMVYEAIKHFNEPEIEVTLEAVLVAVFGLFVNAMSAYFLHREEEKRDVNMHAAYLHVVSDMLISSLALIALLAAQYYNLKVLDPIFALAAAVVILKWSTELIRKSWREVVGL